MLSEPGFCYVIRAWIGLNFHWFHQNSCYFSAMVLRFILDIPTFSRFFFDIPTIFALYLRYHNIFALYPRYLDISRQMWMQNLMKSKDEISEIPKLTTAYQVTKRRFGLQNYCEKIYENMRKGRN